MKLISDMHTHTSVSHHAYSTLSEMCAAGAKRGYRVMAVTNHAPAMPDSAHLWHFACLNELPRMVEGVCLLQGAEVNIMDETGSLDLPEAILQKLDFVVASFHKQVFLQPSYDKCTKALDNVLKNPNVHLLGHLGTAMFEFDYERIISKCAACGKAVELNGSSPAGRPGSYERCFRIAQLCARYGVPVMIDSDAHFSGNLSLSEHAVALAEAAGLPEELVINADYDRLCDYLLLHCGLDPRNTAGN